jgi:UDP-N-acetylglucosamine acyltransferase
MGAILPTEFVEMPVHPTAIIADGAIIDSSSIIGPYAIIGPHVRLGAQCEVGSHAVIEGHTVIGKNNHVHHHAIIGGPPQDLKYDGSDTRLTIGDGNHFREFCTIHRGSQHGKDGTRIGSNNLIMAYAHVAHDCILGNNVILANSVALAGHVEIGDYAVLGGLSAVHQHTRIGAGVMLSGGSMATQDVPPFLIAQGDRARLRGLNRVGLRRQNTPSDVIAALHQAYTGIFLSNTAFKTAINSAKSKAPDHPITNAFFAFLNHSKRGICRAKQ